MQEVQLDHYIVSAVLLLRKHISFLIICRHTEAAVTAQCGSMPFVR